MKMKNFHIYNKVKSMATKAMLFLSLGVLVSVCNLLNSCDAENSISTAYPCRFVFNANLHPGTSIETALNGAGTYTIITTKSVNGIWHIYSTLNDGRNKTEDIAITTATEKYINYSSLGANNGIIIGSNGFGSFDDSAYSAWDRQCPNCIKQYGGTNYPLNWNTEFRQNVDCAKCKRTYSLNTGAVVSGGQKGDKPLMGYRVVYDKQNQRITVGN